MQQGVLPFQYGTENRTGGMTALSGLAVYLEMVEAIGLGESISRHVKVREGGQGWTDRQMVIALILLNLAGGEGVDDLRVLEADKGLGRMLSRAETHRQRASERRAERNRWRRDRRRQVPSPSATFRYLSPFHDASQEELRRPNEAFIPVPNDALDGLGKVNAEMVGFVQGHLGHRQVTLDMDATLIPTNKQEAFYCYKGFKAYQPLVTYWAEADLVVHSEFRDGNVPAGFEQLRVLQESLAQLPDRVDKVMLRSDAAGYRADLLRYCAEGRDERFGVIEFAVGARVTDEFKHEAALVEENEWRQLPRLVGEFEVENGQEWAEVGFVSKWEALPHGQPDYRFIAVRESLSRPPLPGMESELDLSVPVMQMSNHRWYKITGIVTNRDLPGDEVVRWYRERCGKGEEVHSVLKEDLAGGRLPSGQFGANAAWWAITVLAFNLNSAVKQLALGDQWVTKRLKAVRFALINLAGRVVFHARKLLVRLARGHPSFPLLVTAHRRIAALAHGPPRT